VSNVSGQCLGKRIFVIFFGLLLNTTAYALTEWTLHKTPSGSHPDAHEQQMLWLTNRARSNPSREGLWLARSRELHVANGRDYFSVNRRALVEAFSRLKPKPPAAFDVRLYRAALAHSKTQIARDTQDHTGQVERINAEGFHWDWIGYNVYSYADSALNAHAGFNIDWGGGTSTGMQNPPNHRLAIMSVDYDFTNVGIAGIFEQDPRTSVGRYVVSQNFCHAVSDRNDHFNAFVVGTVWRDRNGNDRYDPGEGIEGVSVVPSLGDYYAVTSRGGGYAFPITHRGRLRVQFAGAGLAEANYDVTAAGVSVLVDHKLNEKGKVTFNGRSYREPDVFLAEGVRDTRQFGNKSGNDRHERRVTAYFNYSPEDLLLTFRSRHINRAREAEIFVNGQSLGFLDGSRKSPQQMDQRFVIPSALLGASNRLDIHQRFDDEKWSIERLLLAKATTYQGSLQPGTIDTGPYGWGGGGRHHRAIYRTSFRSNNRDLDLQFRAWDVTQSRDLEIRLNGEHLGWIGRRNRSRRFVAAHIAIPANRQQSGVNIVEFVSHKSDQWGVRDIQLLDVSGPVDELVPGQPDSRRFGWRIPGGRHQTVVRRRFQSKGTDLVLGLRASFSDPGDAVELRVNGHPVGVIHAAAVHQLKRFSIPAAVQKTGENYLEIHRRLRSAQKWSVRDLSLTQTSGPLVALQSDRRSVASSRRYGWRWGSNEHRTVLRSEFLAGQSRSDLLLTGTGYNIRSAKQVSVHLNGQRLGYLSSADGKLNDGDRFILPAENQVDGVNRSICSWVSRTIGATRSVATAKRPLQL